MRRALVILVVAVVAGGGPARAGGAIVMETFEGDRPPDQGAALEPVLGELGRRGFAKGDALSADLRARVSADPGTLAAAQTAGAQHDIDLAYQDFIEGDYDRSLALAQQALDIYASAPGQMAHEPAMRTLQRKAFYIAARSAEVLGRGDDSFALMAEAIRTFPDEQPSTTEFDPRVGALHRRVKLELARQGAGALAIRCDDPAAVIFVDERFAGNGAVSLDAVPPGRYRVHVEKGAQIGRVRTIDVAAGAHASLEIPWLVDGIVRTGPGFVGIDVRGLAPDAQLTAAVRVGRALGASKVVLLGTRALDGRRSIAGFAIDVESQTKTFGAVQLEPVTPAAATLRALADLLAGDRSISAPGLITTEPQLPLGPGPSPPMSRRHKLAIAAGVLALASGGAALGFELSSRSTYDASTREPDNARQNALYESANHKYELAQGFALGAAVLAVGATVLWVNDSPSSESRAVTVIPSVGLTGGSLVLTGSF